MRAKRTPLYKEPREGRGSYVVKYDTKQVDAAFRLAFGFFWSKYIFDLEKNTNTPERTRNSLRFLDDVDVPAVYWYDQWYQGQRKDVRILGLVQFEELQLPYNEMSVPDMIRCEAVYKHAIADFLQPGMVLSLNSQRHLVKVKVAEHVSDYTLHGDIDCDNSNVLLQMYVSREETPNEKQQRLDKGKSQKQKAKEELERQERKELQRLMKKYGNDTSIDEKGRTETPS